MSDKNAFSIDEILEDIKRRKGEPRPAPSVSRTDIDNLIAEIVKERKSEESAPPAGEEPQAAPSAPEVIRETVVSPEPEPVPTEEDEADAEPTKEILPREEAAPEEPAETEPEPEPEEIAPEEPVEPEPESEPEPEAAETPVPQKAEKEKFVVSFDFDKTNPDIHGKPQNEINPNADSSISTVTLLAESAAEQLGRERLLAKEEPAQPEESAEETAEAPEGAADEAESPEEPGGEAVGPASEEDAAPEEAAPAEETEEAEKAEETAPAEEPAAEEPETRPSGKDLEYRTPADEREVYAEINSVRSRLVLRIVLLLVFGGVSLVLLLLERFAPSILPDLFLRSGQPAFFLAVQFVLLAACLFCCFPMIGEGLLAAVRLRANRDSPAAIASLAVLVQMIVCSFRIESVGSDAVHFYVPVVAGILLFGCAAKLMMIGRMILNFRAVTSGCDKYVTSVVEDEDASLELTRGLVASTPVVAVQKKAGFISDFIATSAGENLSDRHARILAPLGVGVSVLLGVVSGLLTRDLAVAFTTAAAVACIFAPFCYLFTSQLPLSRAAKKYNRDGGAILSAEDLDDFCEVNSAVVPAQSLFPGNAVRLFGIKTFAGQRIDDALMDAASVVRESGSVLAPVFSEIIGGDEKLLRSVDSLVYEDGMGISAWVANKRVLIGSRELMINHGISVPSRDYEARFLNEGHELIYLSTSGELTAVFLVKLFAEPEVKEAVRRLGDNGIRLTVKSADAIVTREKLAELFGEDVSFFKILPARLHAEADVQSAPLETSPGPVLGIGTIQSFAGSLVGAKRLRGATLFGVAIQFAAIGLGVLLMIFLTLISGMREMTELSMCLYELLWLAAALLLPRFVSV